MQTKLKKWKKLKSRILLKNKYFTFHHDKVLLPTGRQYDYYFTNKGSRAALVLPVDDRGRVMVCKEFRYPTGRIIYGTVAGSVDRGETPLQTAKRELREEAGYTARDFKLIGKFFGNPGRSGAIFYVYLARGLSKAGEQRLEEAEFIECEFMTISRIEKLIKKGEVVDPYLMSVFLLYFTKYL